jgi:hypothetical protein
LRRGISLIIRSLEQLERSLVILCGPKPLKVHETQSALGSGIFLISRKFEPIERAVLAGFSKIRLK